MVQDYPARATVVEVGPRDGLQNEKRALLVNDKINLIDALSQTGLRHIEAGSFVSPKWVPQMVNSDAVLSGITRKVGVTYSALTPNVKGYDLALAAKADTVAIFASASTAFSMKNINCDIPTSIERFSAVVAQAKKDNIPVRAYVSCVLGCPYEGDVSSEVVLEVTKALLNLGCYEVSLGDTIGTGSALKTKKLTDLLISQLPVNKLALHCHDTYGQALTNVLIGLQQGITTFDSSVAGLGGCPYAAGASGNLASEDLVYMLNNMGIETGIDLSKLAATGHAISTVLGRNNQSKTGSAIMANVAKSKHLV